MLFILAISFLQTTKPKRNTHSRYLIQGFLNEMATKNHILLDPIEMTSVAFVRAYTSHKRTVLSHDPETSVAFTGENESDETGPLCPLKT